MADEPAQEDYTHPAAGWGAALSVGTVLLGDPERNGRPLTRHLRVRGLPTDEPRSA